MQNFIEKLEDNIDTVGAMTVVFEAQTYINTGVDKDNFSRNETTSLIDLLQSWNEVLGIFDFTLLENTTTIPLDVQHLAEARMQAKKAKQWNEADALRDTLSDLGWKIIDEKDGSWHLEKHTS